jgi:hypothetical protein
MPKSICKNCGIEFKYGHSSTGKYCSSACNGEHKSKLHKEDWYAGKLTRVERPTLRRYLSEDRGYACECCGISEWNGKEIILQVDHIDGNPGDDSPNNVRLICPNCHSQTEFLGGRNKGNGRAARGLPLY